jgi:5-methyltetrahydropteroyltriglutamate--homocysteine methyltransferase
VTIFRTDHVGSMVRPARLLDARDDHKAGKITSTQLAQVEDECILEALQVQRAAGIAVLSDGELRRTAYTTDQYDAIEGFAPEYPMVENTLPDGRKVQVEMHTKPVVGKLHQVRRLAEHESSFLKQHAKGTYKITMPTPVRNRVSMQGTIPEPYKTWDEVQQDIVDIFKGEMVALAREGVPYLQFDKVPTVYLTEASRANLQKQGLDPEKAFAQETAWENSCYDAVRAIAPEVTLAMHYCRGNRTGWAGGIGGYDMIAEHAFNELRVDRFLLEFDSERAGGFEPLRYVPRGKTVMLGLVTTKSNQIEKKEDLLRRIEQATKYIPLDQLALGPPVWLPICRQPRWRQHGVGGSKAKDGADRRNRARGLGIASRGVPPRTARPEEA